jgi:cytochrome P450
VICASICLIYASRRMIGTAGQKTVESSRSIDEEADVTTAGTRQATTATVCEALGVPQKDWPLFYRWAGAPLSPKSVDELYYYVDVMLAERCRNPADDLMTTLIALEVDGTKLTVDDIRGFVATLLAGAD